MKSLNTKNNQFNVYKFTIKVTDLTITNISPGKFQNYGDIVYDRLGVLDPSGLTGYQIQVKSKSPQEARKNVIELLKNMGWIISPQVSRGK